MTPLHSALPTAFPPPFARFGETLGPPCAEATPLLELLGRARLGAVASQYAASFPGGEWRAALSLWSQHYLLALIPCATAAALVARRDLPVALGGMGAVLTTEGEPCRLCIPHEGCVTAETCPVRRLAPLLHTHLAPLAESLAGAGLSPLIFWSNAAATLAWTLGVITAPEADCAALRAAMSAPRWADDAPNPFRRILGTDPTRRRICCLRFRLGTMGRCPDCPIAQTCASRQPSAVERLHQCQ